ncbi:MAG: 3,4-dihydroxy-2-butanone-4-phosphate synthase [Deltaproteobacteria bacterium]|nr:3,4-dihydroxy-2-butanone-4-phosphate synthase [Deltaproteobacteria bacterium]
MSVNGVPPPSSMDNQEIRSAISDIAAGKMLILVDDEDRENEGDLVIAAEKVTPESVNFMATHGRGLICLSLTEAQIQRLGLKMMVERNQSAFQTGFTVSIEAREGVTTGISAHDRAHTIRVASNPNASATDVVSPGHVFPIRARDGGVLVRSGQTEGSVDLARLAGLVPAAVICEIMNPDGTMARRPDLERFAESHGLCIVTIADLIQYRLAHETLLSVVAERRVSTHDWGEITATVIRSVDGREHLVLRKGDLGPQDVPLVRVQSIELPADLVGLALSGGGAEMRAAMSRICEEGKGVFVYLVHEASAGAMSERLSRLGRGRSNYNRVGGRLDLRELGIGAQCLKLAGVRRFRLMSNNVVRIVGLDGYGLELVDRVPLPIPEPMEQLE